MQPRALAAPAAHPSELGAPLLERAACNAVIVTGSDGAVLDCDETVERLTGWPLARILGRHVSDFFPGIGPGPVAGRGGVDDTLRYRCRIGERFRGTCADGSAFQARLFPVALRDGVRETVRFVVSPVGTAD